MIGRNDRIRHSKARYCSDLRCTKAYGQGQGHKGQGTVVTRLGADECNNATLTGDFDWFPLIELTKKISCCSFTSTVPYLNEFPKDTKEVRAMININARSQRLRC
jgi:hypothetical protein